MPFARQRNPEWVKPMMQGHTTPVSLWSRVPEHDGPAGFAHLSRIIRDLTKGYDIFPEDVADEAKPGIRFRERKFGVASQGKGPRGAYKMRV